MKKDASLSDKNNINLEFDVKSSTVWTFSPWKISRSHRTNKIRLTQKTKYFARISKFSSFTRKRIRFDSITDFLARKKKTRNFSRHVNFSSLFNRENVLRKFMATTMSRRRFAHAGFQTRRYKASFFFYSHSNWRFIGGFLW